ncbi:MAG: hypothetical protein O6763_00385 [Gammaproteobacteria bacterium]|nr:hypothetical protein [Gammaproteobacteria bacterium]
MSEQAGADLPEARDGEGQLSKDALRLPAAGTAPGSAVQIAGGRGRVDAKSALADTQRRSIRPAPAA